MSESTQNSKFAIRTILGFGVILLACIAAYQFTRPKLTICKKSMPQAIAYSLESAVSNFFIEYGTLPSEKGRVVMDTEEGVKLITVLLGSGTGPNMQRPRFLSVREGKNRKNGLTFNSSGKPEGLFDSWGSPYTVELDASYQDHLHFMIGAQTIELKSRRVAVYSPGPDKQLGTGDDIRTW